MQVNRKNPLHTNNYYEKTLKLLAQREKERPLKTFRKAVIDSQHRMNYRDEYDRIRGYLSNRSILPPAPVSFTAKAPCLSSSCF